MSGNNNKIQPSNAELVTPINNPVNYELFAKMEQFQARLNSPPIQNEVQLNKYAGNSKYLPISFVEMQLDELYFGQWSTINFKTQVIANELIGSLELVVVHPVSGKEIIRIGAASVMIQMKKGSKVLDAESKHMNTLVKDHPHLKASCIMNAAKSLGKIFGRDLNRDIDKTDHFYQTPILNHVNEKVKTLKESIDDCLTIGDLQEFFQDNQKAIVSNTSICEAYNTKKREFKKQLKVA